MIGLIGLTSYHVENRISGASFVGNLPDYGYSMLYKSGRPTSNAGPSEASC